MVNEYLDAMNDDMKSAIAALEKELITVRTGRASPQLLENVRVDVAAYGGIMPLNQLASIAAPDARMLVVTPWDKSVLTDVEKAIASSGLGLNPSSDGQIVRVPIPALTGEHRELVALFDVPRFFALDSPLRHYLTFVESELARGLDNSATSFQQDRLAATLLGSLKARLGASGSAAQRRIDLNQIDRFIRRHLADELRVADLAKLACLSEAHFSERFRAQTGLSPWQYVRRQRLHAARQLVMQSRLPLTDIAIQTGFANQSALSHAFRRSYGASPRQLRQGFASPSLDTNNRSTAHSTALSSSATPAGAGALSSR